MTDAKSSRWLQEPEKNIKLFKTKPVTDFLQEKFICWLIIAINFEQRDVIVLAVWHLYNNWRNKKN